MALPLRSWVYEGNVEPEAIAACLIQDCERRIAVAVYQARGPEAERLAALLRDPNLLRRELEQRSRERREARIALLRRRTPRAAVSIEPWSEAGFSGFVVSLARPDGERPAHGAVLGTLGDPLRFVVAVTDRAETARLKARAAAEANLR